MRILASFVLASAAIATPAAADAFLKREPLILPPYVTVLVDSAKCGAGRVMKVRGAIPGRERQRMCVPMGPEQAARNGNLL